MASDAIALELVEQDDLVVTPDTFPQIVEQFDDRHDLLGRPVRIDQQGQAMAEPGRLMMTHTGVSLVLRFLDLAVGNHHSCAQASAVFLTKEAPNTKHPLAQNGIGETLGFMNSRIDLQTLLYTLSEPITAANVTAHTVLIRTLEAELCRQLLEHQNAPDTLIWFDTLRPPPATGSRIALQRAISRALPVPKDPSVPDAYVGFCPVTLVMTCRTAPLPSLTPDFFCFPHAQPLIDTLEGHGLAEDAQIAMAAVLYPLSVMARWRASQLPFIARTLTPVKKQSVRPQDSEPAALPINQDDLMGSLTVAGDRIVGSFLLPVIFYGETMPRAPRAMTGQIPTARRDACATELSRSGTLMLDGRLGLGIETHIGYPRFLLDAMDEVLTSHASLSTYWTARLAVREGLSVGTLTYAAGPDGRDLAIGFQVGGAIVNNLQLLAGTQWDIDRYTRAMTRAARDAGLTRIHHITHAPDWSRDSRRAGSPNPADRTRSASAFRKG